MCLYLTIKVEKKWKKKICSQTLGLILGGSSTAWHSQRESWRLALKDTRIRGSSACTARESTAVGLLEFSYKSSSSWYTKGTKPKECVRSKRNVFRVIYRSHRPFFYYYIYTHTIYIYSFELKKTIIFYFSFFFYVRQMVKIVFISVIIKLVTDIFQGGINYFYLFESLPKLFFSPNW